jgi:hypothetical protein
MSITHYLEKEQYFKDRKMLWIGSVLLSVLCILFQGIFGYYIFEKTWMEVSFKEGEFDHEKYDADEIRESYCEVNKITFIIIVILLNLINAYELYPRLKVLDCEDHTENTTSSRRFMYFHIVFSNVMLNLTA